MIKRRHSKPFNGVLEGFLGKIHRNCRMDGIEEVWDAGNHIRRYFRRPGFLAWYLAPDPWVWSKRHCLSVPITLFPPSTAQNSKSKVRLTDWWVLSLVPRRVQRNSSSWTAAGWGLRGSGVFYTLLWFSSSQSEHWEEAGYRHQHEGWTVVCHWTEFLSCTCSFKR